MIFDVDDTLVDDSGTWTAAVEQTARALVADPGCPSALTTNDIAGSYRQTSSRLWDAYETELRPLGDSGSIRRYVWERALAELGWVAGDELVRRTVDDFARLRLDLLRPAAGVRESLCRIQRFARLSICTNGRHRDQVEKLRRVGLADVFSVLTCGQDIGVRKPDPEIFRRSCAAVGALPAQCLYVGNDWVLDVEGARNAGLRPVWIPTVTDRAPDGDVVSREIAVFASVIAFADALVATAEADLRITADG